MDGVCPGLCELRLRKGFTEEVTFELTLQGEKQFAEGWQGTCQSQRQAPSGKGKQLCPAGTKRTSYDGAEKVGRG